MVIVTWGFTTAPGKVWDGVEHAKKVIEHAEKVGWGASKWWLVRPRTGSFNRFTMAAQFASFGEYGESRERGDADPEAKALAKERHESDWFVDVETTIGEVIDEG